MHRVAWDGLQHTRLYLPKTRTGRVDIATLIAGAGAVVVAAVDVATIAVVCFLANVAIVFAFRCYEAHVFEASA